MHQSLLDLGVPTALFLLMLISGTEIRMDTLVFGKEYRGSLVRGIGIQLILAPLLALIILKIFNPDPRLASGVIILTLCPGGGISNYYTYLAKCDVLLSASITSIGTVLSLVTIPIWLLALKTFPLFEGIVPNLPVGKILSVLILFIVIPLGIGFALTSYRLLRVAQMKKGLQIFSLVLIFLILFFNCLHFYDRLMLHLFSIIMYALCFILGSMFLAYVLTARIPPHLRPVLIIEGAVRNIGIALIIVETLFPSEMLALLTSFLIGYFVIEILVMLTYARSIFLERASL